MKSLTITTLLSLIVSLMVPCVPFLLEIGSELRCKQQRGYCSFGRCVPPARPIGRCTGQTICCRGLWG
uniref:Beta-defensin-like domain-containing protein n=2 Tax=Passerellidae TaxID=1729112 RepID=A0A8D2NG40_ZONAL